MTAANYNLTIDQGSDFAIQLTLSEDNSAKNLTGYEARAQMRSKKSDVSAAAAFTCTIVDAVLGKIKVSMAWPRKPRQGGMRYASRTWTSAYHTLRTTTWRRRRAKGDGSSRDSQWLQGPQG